MLTNREWNERYEKEFIGSPLVKGPLVSECDSCGELAHNDDFTEFRVNRRHVHFCPMCTDKQREEQPRSEVL